MKKQFIWSRLANILFPVYCVNCFSPQRGADLFRVAEYPAACLRPARRRKLWEARRARAALATERCGDEGSKKRNSEGIPRSLLSGGSFLFLCARCFLFIRQKKNPVSKLQPYKRVLSYGSYADPVLQKVIFQFKYRFVKELADPLSELLEATLNEGGVEIFLRPPLPVVTFIPLAPLRERWRGFNQSQLLAWRVASSFNVPLLPLLERAWLAPAQAKMRDEDVRKKIIKDAFRLSAPKSPAPQKVLLVDDVLTSGATLKEAGRVLKRWGVKELWGLTVAG